MLKKKVKAQEIAELLFLRIKTGIKNSWEYAKVVTRYYQNSSFAKADLLLLKEYITKNPFRMSRQQLQTMGESNVYSYGETPLTSMEMIANNCGITAEDTVFELGMGRGRTCFWLNRVLGCSVVGIEWLPSFVTKAQVVSEKMKLSNLFFRNEDFLDASFDGATVLYLYGTCLDSKQIKKLCSNFLSLPKGTKIITVSYPLTEYDKNFEVLQCFSVPFTWGSADVFLQVKNH